MNSINCHEKEGGTNRYAKRMVNGPIDVCFKKKKKEKSKRENRNGTRFESKTKRIRERRERVIEIEPTIIVITRWNA